MTRTDAIIAAVSAMLEARRDLLDSAVSIRAVRLDVKLNTDQQVRALVFSPEIEHAIVPTLDRYVFDTATR